MTVFARDRRDRRQSRFSLTRHVPKGRTGQNCVSGRDAFTVAERRGEPGPERFPARCQFPERVGDGHPLHPC